jgi:hypothetical protein
VFSGDVPVDEKAIRAKLGQFIRHHAFNHLAVPELEPHPKPLAAGAGGKGFPVERLGIIELPDKIHSLDLFQINEYLLAAGVQQLQFASGHEAGRRHMSLDSVAVQLAHDYFLMGRRHSRY